MDMGLKGVRGEGECGPKRIKLVCWGAIGEGVKSEVDTGQGDVGLIKERGEAQVEAEDSHGGERYAKGVRKRFIEGFL